MTTATRSALHTPLCERLGIRSPICQAGMAFVARAQFAAAVSAAGGLGVIAAAHGTEHGSAAAGQSAGLVHDVRSVADVMTSIVEEAEAILHRLGSRA
jgi:NAD(P)H-dependent flavin oxidoreductase YrpB (nitropropane dioxygenase family)